MPEDMEVTADHVEEELDDKEKVVREIEDKVRTYLATQTYRVVIPSFSKWFARDKIHEIERKSLPEFFNGRNKTKTPETYLQYRDFMVDIYRLNPSEYLTVTACRRNLAGDVATIFRVHKFLETWGLINYQIDPDTRPSIAGPQYTGHFQVTLDAPKGLEPLIPLEGATMSTQGQEDDHTSYLVDVANEATEQEQHKTPLNLELRRSIYDSSSDAMALLDENQRRFNALTTRQYNCFTCGDDITKVRFHNLQSKQAISAVAFNSGLFPSNFTAGDYVKLVQAQQNASAWSDQETLLLLEGVEMYDSDWEAIAYHVGTRNKEACLVKFLQMPIEDAYLVKNAEEKKDTSSISQLLEKVLSSVKDLPNSSTLAENAQAGSAQVKQEQDTYLHDLVKLQMQKIDLKLEKIDELDQVLKMQRREIEKQRLDLYLDRLSLNQQTNQVLTTLREAAQAQGQTAVELAEKARELAFKNPKHSVLQDTSAEARLAEVPNPSLKPISLETPQQYKFWSA